MKKKIRMKKMRMKKKKMKRCRWKKPATDRMSLNSLPYHVEACPPQGGQTIN